MMDVLELLKKHGFEAAEIPMGDLVYAEESRAYCAANKCRSYGATWACPPAVGTLEACRARCLEYRRFLLLARAYPLEDSWDFEAMGAAHRDFQTQLDALDDALRASGEDSFLLLGNEGCVRCGVCTWPDAPCRFPQRLHPSLEGFGFLVSELAAAAGLAYRAKNGVAYFGAILLPGEAGTGTAE